MTFRLLRCWHVLLGIEIYDFAAKGDQIGVGTDG